MTGYTHNSVTPFCMPASVPVRLLQGGRGKQANPQRAGMTLCGRGGCAWQLILSKSVAELPFFWLGGGEVDLKLGVDTREFIAGAKPYVMPCTRPKTP